VVGYGNKIASEVNVSACATRGVPILRRCSGGGTVVQGAGCLNYAVILRASDSGELATVTGTNQFVMEQNRAALEQLLSKEVTIQGHTDLALQHNGVLLKFSGNAQRRRRNAVLFHGTLLYGFNLSLASELLHAPSKQPEYRAAREHSAFITNISATADKLKKALAAAWCVEGFLDAPRDAIEQLARERYERSDWNADR
jgi:lipoate---protein ligase